MSPPKQIFIAVIGVGGVGKVFMSQLSHLSSGLHSSQSVKKVTLSLVLVARSSRMLWSEDFTTLSFKDWERSLANSKQPSISLNTIFDMLVTAPGPVILVDNTSNQEIAEQYPVALRRGISIVTPNKKAFSGSKALWDDIMEASGEGKALMYHESSVGAGLPVISTLKELVETGDEVRKIEGVFSGTMSFLFNKFSPVTGEAGGKWSEEVQKAKDLGYTEPDPRDDLNGVDVARKLTILARIIGLPVESPASFPVQSLIPKALESAKSGDEFLANLSKYDSQMETLKTEAARNGKVLRYVGSIDVPTKSLEVKVEQFDKSHPIAALQGSDNIISFYTNRYGQNPLIIQGAGAGADVTAMGVTGDLIKALQILRQ